VQISLGDFVLSGGELPALALLDAVARLQPGVLGDAGSHQQDSFNPALDGLLDSPHYTRPEVWQGPQGPVAVPEVLLGGPPRAHRPLAARAAPAPDRAVAPRPAGHRTRRTGAAERPDEAVSCAGLKFKL
jgi:tRNA (guanine37-N1)-methyltransferase